LDASLLGVAPELLCGDLPGGDRRVWDPAIEALTDHHGDPDLDHVLDHVEPAGGPARDVEREAVVDVPRGLVQVSPFLRTDSYGSSPRQQNQSPRTRLAISPPVFARS
jgi:hypothetical protein